MSKEQELKEAGENNPKAKIPSQAKKQETVVYCAPSVRGVAQQYTVYANGIPERIQDFLHAHPAAAGLVVSIDRFAETRKNLEKPDTAESILFAKARQELKGEN